MRRKFVAPAAVALLAFSTGPSNSADIPPLAPEPLVYDHWTGFYLGAGGGYRWADFSFNSDFCDDVECGLLEDQIGDFELTGDGFFGTVEGGYDWQVAPSFVLGVLASFDFGESLGDDRFRDLEGIGPFDDPGEGLSWDTDLNNVFTVAGRAGFVWDRAMLYGLVGWSWASGEAEISAICDSAICDGADFSNDTSVNGLTLGGGIEFLFTENLSGRIEYRHIDFSEIDADGDFGEFTADIENDLTLQSIRGTIDFRF